MWSHLNHFLALPLKQILLPCQFGFPAINANFQSKQYLFSAQLPPVVNSRIVFTFLSHLNVIRVC